MFINTTFQTVHGAGEFQMAGLYWLLYPLRIVSLKGNTPNFQEGNNVDPWTSEKEGYALHWLPFEANVCTRNNRPFDTHVA